jgi:hypothetical protein
MEPISVRKMQARQRALRQIAAAREGAVLVGQGRGRKKLLVVTLPASNRGRNARYFTGAKPGWGTTNPKPAKRAKRQGNERMGNVPALRTSKWPTTE